MATLTAANALGQARRVVLKIGSALLVDAETGRLRQDWLDGLAADVAALRAAGAQVVVVSSGAIALGRRVLKLDPGALSLEHSQAAAAVGQIQLARAYEHALAPHGVTTAQVLVTLDDSTNRRRYLNSRATMGTLVGLGVVPIVNENDTVATDEIRFGDNDRLAAQVAAMVGADTLVLLSDIDGLYSSDPRKGPAERIDVVTAITPEIEAMAGGPNMAGAKGGMKTKVWAARTATAAGCHVVLCAGDVPQPLAALQNGGAATLFTAASNPTAARKQWIDAMKPKGAIVVDAGAVTALRGGKSLLPAGVRRIEGRFERGDPVDIVDEAGHFVARALTGYDAGEARAIAGMHSRDIAAVLGHDGRAVLVHRDDMAFKGAG